MGTGIMASEAVRRLEENGDNIYNETSSILVKLLGNLSANPNEAKYRSVRLSNPKISAAIVSVQGALDILKAAGFVEEGDAVVFPSTGSMASVEEALAQVQLSIASRAAGKQSKVDRAADRARQAYVDEQTKKKEENERRKALIKSKIAGNKKEEKEFHASVKQERAFGAGSKNSATQVGAAGDDKGG